VKVISLGWGVQSFTLAAMCALGELEPVDYVIHADTLHESELTYQYAEKMTPWLEERGIKVVTVKNKTGTIWENIDKDRIYLPLFTKYSGDTKLVNKKELLWDENNEEFEEIITDEMVEVSAGKPGQFMRICTERWKIRPIHKFCQVHRNGERVETWLGISTDEWQRMKPDRVKYIERRWPLIEKRMSRQDCYDWLSDKGIDLPARSACTFCPYHNTIEWREMKDRGGHDWEEAVAVDKAVRHMRIGEVFIHPSRIPLDEVDFRSAKEMGQLSLWDNECEGMCGL